MARQLSPSGRGLIQKLEGLSLTAYPDAGGWSIGYGHFLGKDNHEGERISRAQAEALFEADVRKYVAAVNSVVPSSAQHEFDAMVSLAWNIGTEGVKRSTVVRKHKAGDRQGAADAFEMWNESQGEVNPVLVRRRAMERDIYLHGFLPGFYAAPAWGSSDDALGWAAAVAVLAYVALPRIPAARRLLA